MGRCRGVLEGGVVDFPTERCLTRSVVWMIGEAIGKVGLEGGYVKDIDEEDQRDIGARLRKGGLLVF